jgi:hypothetical protein
MNCPRCHTEVPDEELRCPDCKLPKPKRPGGQSEAMRQKTDGQTKKASNLANENMKGKVKQRPKWVLTVAGTASILVLCGIGFYLLHLFSSGTQEIDPKAALPMLNKLRNSPSSQEGLSVDELLTHELDRSRRVGNLLRYQGWTMKPVNGSKTKLLISFSFEESDNTQQRAEWIADLAQETFTPQTDLAMAVYRK